ncbi:tRNA 2-thiouridine(34) synthase MnmA [Buchnera aphidicola]|uniref:tRNA-specific 2-thiouridylase MnmA n=1 Tax=Buchnera aphidicola (Sarucallis kahawaluokalani) TaxID=1241878 RepID=A0A4D6Y7S3_9GAMM|nr:tRNA 2-thiouridine(34) synthase MnmA [Buchnera aphidicola]QCI25976.1 tRNA 2-thiouridine(34) synthase MnmA [Buchnera aphidicola (Sarucallis kahawaluokalani)]
MKNKKVIVAMSGGVDSAVSAYLLLKKGYVVEGIFMKNWEEDDNVDYCASAKDLYDTRIVCKKLGIYLHEVNFSTEYWDNVFEKFLLSYKQGNTPNPDILCNKKIKFGLLFDFVIYQLRADFLATGHYAQIKSLNRKNMLIRSIDLHKDQSYFLYTLSNYKLKKILFPVGHLKKKKVRNIAHKIHLHNAYKKDSTGICFIGPRKMHIFLHRFIGYRSGNIVDQYGYIIGVHNGLVNYTIGQRKNIGIGGRFDKQNMPWYVVEKNFIKNSLVVVQGRKNIQLFSIGLIAINVHWINKINIFNNLSCTVKVRYCANDIKCRIYLLNLYSVKIIFEKPISSIAPGQSVVFYSHKICLGGGVIKKSIPYA